MPSCTMICKPIIIYESKDNVNKIKLSLKLSKLEFRFHAAKNLHVMIYLLVPQKEVRYYFRQNINVWYEKFCLTHYFFYH